MKFVFSIDKKRVSVLAWPILSLSVCSSIAVGAPGTVTLEFSPAFSNSNVSMPLWEEKSFQVFRNGSFAMASHGKNINDYYFSSAWPSNGTDYFAILTEDSEPITHISRIDASLFKPIQIDLAEYSFRFVAPKEITFTGVKDDHSTVSVTFTIDGVMDGDGGSLDFETFTFPSSFTDLRDLEIHTQVFAMDNLQMHVVPEGDALQLLALAFWAGLYSARSFYRRIAA